VDRDVVVQFGGSRLLRAENLCVGKAGARFFSDALPCRWVHGPVLLDTP